jgi:hypothetical protein
MNIVVARGVVVKFSDLPPHSIALDGYVQGPAIAIDTERFSFDHHDGCVRLLTRATCQQVMDALLLGLDPTGYTIYVNDVDGDTALAVWLLKNPLRVTEEFVRRLVETVGAVDAHGPAYPTLEPKLADAFFQGAMKPVSELQRAKKYGEANLDELLAICVENIEKLVAGTLEWTPRPEKERSFEITHTGNGWVMAKSDDFIFDLLYANGHTKAIAYQVLGDGSVAYTVGKKSELVTGFPVGPHSKPGTILHALNEHEKGWGGGSTIGGAPRNADGSRSRLTPDEVWSIVDRLVTVGS